MSNVYTRNRKKTPFDVLANAEKLQDLVTLYVMNERYVPKKWRFMIGQDLIKKIDELNDNIIAANSMARSLCEFSAFHTRCTMRLIKRMTVVLGNNKGMS